MDACLNCSADLTGKYCAACGEKRLSKRDYAIGHFVAHAMHDLTHFDAKIFSSLIPLIFRPGLLTAEFLAGKRTRYIKPTTLFVLLNLFFFFARGGLLGWNAATYIHSAGAVARQMTDRLTEERGQSRAQYEEHFTEVAREHQRTIFFYAIPALGIALLALFWKRYYVEHLIYSIHFHAWLMVFMTVGIRAVILLLLQLRWIGLPLVAGYVQHEPGLNYLVASGIFIYHFVALPRVYRIGKWRATAAGIALIAAEVLLVVYLYQPILFFWTYYTA